jgi:hypothetical protein
MRFGVAGVTLMPRVMGWQVLAFMLCSGFDPNKNVDSKNHNCIMKIS